jgi:NAD(P)-dependent dehydrogenase (short-subunit alcohol dehydrogenase family)
MAAGGGASLFDLTDKVALVTGGTSGIGAAIAKQFALAGARVVIASEDAADCERVAAAMRRDGHAVTGAACDVAYRREVEDLAAAVTELHGRVDILVCSAGIAPPSGPIANATDRDWDRTMTINLRSLLWLANLVIPGMAERRDGSVIFVSSIAGLRGNKALGLYGVSKAAGAQLARNLAVEWGPSNVRVNAISPGVIETRFAAPMLDDADVMSRRLALTPLRRIGKPEEVAGLALLLASRAGAFITGQNIVVDGGTLIGDGN